MAAWRPPLDNEVKERSHDQQPQKAASANRRGDLVVSGSIAALRDLAEPSRRSPTFSARSSPGTTSSRAALAGPRSSDERGPAQQPSWVKQGPRIDRVEEEVRNRHWPSWSRGAALRPPSTSWIDGSARSRLAGAQSRSPASPTSARDDAFRSKSSCDTAGGRSSSLRRRSVRVTATRRRRTDVQTTCHAGTKVSNRRSAGAERCSACTRCS